MKNKKTKESMMMSLEQNLPLSSNEELSIQSSELITKINIEAEEDYNYARIRIKKLIDTSDEAISTLHALAADSEHPRAFEVLSGFIKNAADINNQLLTLQKDRKKLLVGDERQSSSNNTTNNAIFVGTTTELQKFLKSQREVIDIKDDN